MGQIFIDGRTEVWFTPRPPDLAAELMTAMSIEGGGIYVFGGDAVPVVGSLPWSEPSSTPVAGIRDAMRRMLAAPPEQYRPPILSPPSARLYNRILSRLAFREELRQRMVRDKRLRPMRQAYRSRSAPRNGRRS